MVNLDIPEAWSRLPLPDLTGVLLIVGGLDSGKSTFGRYLYEQQRRLGRLAAFIDGDPGQSALGPPTTLTLWAPAALGPSANTPDVEQALGAENGLIRRWFVGSITPSGHMLEMVVGAGRLVQAARQVGAQVIIYDTSGLIDPNAGGMALKQAKVDLLQPEGVFAIQREQEMKTWLAGLRRSRRTKVYDLAPSPAVRPRDRARRQAYRERRLAAYFEAARPLVVEWPRLAVLPGAPRFRRQQLVAFEDAQGFTLALGIVMEVDPPARRVTLLTPLDSLAGVQALHLGDVLVDAETFHHERL